MRSINPIDGIQVSRFYEKNSQFRRAIRFVDGGDEVEVELPAFSLLYEDQPTLQELQANVTKTSPVY